MQKDDLLLIGQILTSLANIGNVITDLFVIHSYYKKGYEISFWIFISTYIINTIFQIVVGCLLETSEEKKRYTSNQWFNHLFGCILSILQLRILIETYYVYKSWKIKHNKNHTIYFSPRSPLSSFSKLDETSEQMTVDKNNQLNDNVRKRIVSDDTTTTSNNFNKRSRTRASLALMRGMLQDAPELILRGYVIIRHNDFSFINIFSFFLSLIMLSIALCIYTCRLDPISIQMISGFHILGQIGMRISMIMFFFYFITDIVLRCLFCIILYIFVIIWSTGSKLARKSNRFIDRIYSSILLSPLFYIFALNLSGKNENAGMAKEIYLSLSSIKFIIWRFIENIFGLSFVTIYHHFKNNKSNLGINTLMTTKNIWILSGGIFGNMFLIAFILMSLLNRLIIIKKQSHDKPINKNNTKNIIKGFVKRANVSNNGTDIITA